jgi:ribosomal protein S18 acetylase RimI-like enzyme
MKAMPKATGLFEAHLTVADLERSVEFYRDLVGLPLALELPERGAAFLWIGGAGKAMLGLWSLGSAPVALSLHIALNASLQEVLRACNALRANGVTPLSFCGAETTEPSADYRPYSFTAFCDEHLRPHDFDPELSHVAESDGRPVGFLLARRRRQENTGFIDLLGVHPEHRTRGLATAMLQNAFARFAAAGLRHAELGVASDNPNALRLYARCGMSKRLRYDTYHRAAGESIDEGDDTAGEARPAGSNTTVRSATEAEASTSSARRRPGSVPRYECAASSAAVFAAERPTAEASSTWSAHKGSRSR